jgi:hypothetical protein
MSDFFAQLLDRGGSVGVKIEPGGVQIPAA